MKLSARNLLPGKVVAVTKGSTTAHVNIELVSGADGHVIDHQRGRR